MKISDTLLLREWLMSEPNLAVNAISPIVVDEGVRYPYIAYQRQSVEVCAWKRACDIDSATFDIVVWSDDYDETIVIAERVIEVLNAHDVTVNQITEGWQNNAFFQSINCTMK